MSRRTRDTDINRRRVERLIARDGMNCQMCGYPMVLEPRDADEAASIDHHPVPLAYGGSNEMDNLRLVHRACNEIAGRASERELIRRGWNKGNLGIVR